MGIFVNIKNALSTPRFHVMWTVIRRFVESVQILDLLLIPSFSWPSDVLDAVDSTLMVSWISIDAEGSTYNALLITLCAILTLYVVIAALVLISGCIGCECMDCLECGEDLDIGEYLWWFIGDSLLFGVIFVPIGRILIEVFHCKKGAVFKNASLECGEAEHVSLCIWSSISFLFLIAFIYFRANAHDVLQHNPRMPSKIRDDVHDFDAYYSFFRLSAVIVTVIVAESSPVISSFLLLIAFLIPIAFTLHRLPFVDMRYNHIRCGMDSFNLWSCFALFVVAVIDDRHSYCGPAVWCFFPVFMAFCCFLCELRLEKRPLSARDLREPEDDAAIAMSDRMTVPPLLLNEDQSKCIMLTVDNTADFMQILKARNEGHCVCIIGVNRGRKRENEESKRWNEEQIDSFCDILRECSNLKLLALNSWIFEKEQLVSIISALCSQEKQDLKVIDLGSNQLELEDAKAVLDLIENKRKEKEWFLRLEQINFVGNYVNSRKWTEQLIDVHTLGQIVFI